MSEAVKSVETIRQKLSKSLTAPLSRWARGGAKRGLRGCRT